MNFSSVLKLHDGDVLSKKIIFTFFDNGMRFHGLRETII